MQLVVYLSLAGIQPGVPKLPCVQKRHRDIEINTALHEALQRIGRSKIVNKNMMKAGSSTEAKTQKESASA